VLFVERSDYSDQTIAEFGLQLDTLADELPGHRVFLLIDLSEVSKMPSPNQEKALQHLYRVRSAADQSSQGAHSSSTSPGKT
jgi:hypothetical protein